MESFGIYSLKAAVILILFWAIYSLFLQKETFYRFNRFFLLTGLWAAVILPLITIRYTIEVNTPSAIPVQIITVGEYAATTAETNTPENSFIKYFDLFLPAIYLIVLGIIAMFRMIGLSRLLRTIRQNNSQRYANYNLIESSEFEGAFSFFRFVIIPKSVNQSEKAIILKHEEAHIRQKHWIDLLLTNIASLIWWFNPIIRLYEKAIRNNHEYLADREVLTNYEQTTYQQTLVNQWFHTSRLPMAHSFSYSNRLKRINMMKKNISNPLKKGAALFAIPGICLFLWSFAEPEYIVINGTPSEKDITMYNREISDKKLHEIETDHFQSMTTRTTDPATEKYELNDQNGAMEDTTWNTTHIKEQFPEINFRNMNPDILVIIDGEKNKERDQTLKTEDIEAISVLKEQAAVTMYGEEGKNGVILITTKKKQDKNPPVTPDKNDSIRHDSVKSSYVGRLKYSSFSQSNNGTKVAGLRPRYIACDSPIGSGQSAFNLYSPDPPLYIVDGEKTDSLQHIDPNEIHSIAILKDKSTTERYGEEGKNGIILVTTKKGRAIALKESSYEVQGTITNEAGEPIKNAYIKVGGDEMFADQNGAFTSRIVSGDWLLITADGYDSQTIQTEEDNSMTFFTIILKKASDNYP